MLTMLESRLIKDRNKYTPASGAQCTGGGWKGPLQFTMSNVVTNTEVRSDFYLSRF